MIININFLVVLFLVYGAYCQENAENTCMSMKEEIQILRQEFRVLKKETDSENMKIRSENMELRYENMEVRNELGAVKKELQLIKDGSNNGEKRFLANGEMDLETTVTKLKQDVKMLTDGIGSTYVRWGRTTCPGNTTVIYKGFMGGNVYTDNGGPANYLCLPDDPTWAKYQDGIQNEGNKIYGSEYEHSGTNFNPFHQNMFNEDIPCAVCSTKRPLNIMVPARTSCYTGWYLEYTGYLMTIRSDHPAAGEYVCVDDHPEPIPHGTANTNGNVMYLVEAVCGTLPCLPYVNGRELACSVCSK